MEDMIAAGTAEALQETATASTAAVPLPGEEEAPQDARDGTNWKSDKEYAWKLTAHLMNSA